MQENHSPKPENKPVYNATAQISKQSTTELITSYGILPNHMAQVVAELSPAKIAIIMDEKIDELYPQIRQVVAEFDRPIFYKTLYASEQNKSYEQKQNLELWLLEHAINRQDLVLAIGGGMISDLAGAAAEQVKRGIPWIIIPTTLLSMVDASIGGKVAINTQYGKNTLGAFHVPRYTITDIEFLNTLPIQEVKSGLIEWLKTCLLQSQEAYTNVAEILFQDHGLLEISPTVVPVNSNIKSNNYISHSININKLIKELFNAQMVKWEIINQDPEEKTGLRKILNYGHTWAHALELITHYQLTHGEAVAWGIQFANFVAVQESMLPNALFERIFHDFLTWKLLQPLPHFSNQEIEAQLAIMENDKKNSGKDIHFVLLSEYGLVFDVGKLNKAYNATALSKKPSYTFPITIRKIRKYLSTFLTTYNKLNS